MRVLMASLYSACQGVGEEQRVKGTSLFFRYQTELAF